LFGALTLTAFKNLSGLGWKNIGDERLLSVLFFDAVRSYRR
jgi:hypothetical protein